MKNNTCLVYFNNKVDLQYAEDELRTRGFSDVIVKSKFGNNIPKPPVLKLTLEDTSAVKIIACLIENGAHDVLFI